MRQPWGSSCLSSETSLCLRDDRAHSQVPSRRGSLQNGTFRMGELLANRGLGKEMPDGGKSRNRQDHWRYGRCLESKLTRRPLLGPLVREVWVEGYKEPLPGWQAPSLGGSELTARSMVGLEIIRANPPHPSSEPTGAPA